MDGYSVYSAQAFVREMLILLVAEWIPQPVAISFAMLLLGKCKYKSSKECIVRVRSAPRS